MMEAAPEPRAIFGKASPSDSDGETVEKVQETIKGLTPGQRKAYRVIRNAGDDFITSKEICDKADLGRAQFSGIISWSNRRIGIVPHNDDTRIIEKRWNRRAGMNEYRMTAVAREAFDLEYGS
jgi:hypothetical protein